MARMFGTDGVRGVANKDLSCELALKIGKAGAYVLTNEVHQPRILLGRDTRLSGDMLSAALTAGICSVGGDVIDVGVIPTPAMAYLARAYEADAAVMVSASHNTMEYNGIKWFDGKGFKLSDALATLARHIHCGEEFPHEVGIFLDYPLADVIGFIRHQGAAFCCVGCWKAYTNEEQARRTFALYRKCRMVYLACYHNKGYGVTRLTVAA